MRAGAKGDDGFSLFFDASGNPTMPGKPPGGSVRGCLESHRAGLENARINNDLKQQKLTLPIMTLSAAEFFGPLVADHADCA